jgi:uncharacterized protein (TIGR03435 family)
MVMKRRSYVYVLLVWFATQSSIGQTNQRQASFEVASVRRSDPNARGGRAQFLEGGRFLASNVPLDYLIRQAYELDEKQLLGGPSWISVDRYDIQAKADVHATEADLRVMVRDLLAVRFQFKNHWESKEIPIYNLLVDKKGLKMQRAREDDVPGGGVNIGREMLSGHKVTMARLADALSRPRLLDRPVLDKTNLAGVFDFKLQWRTSVANSGAAAQNPDDSLLPPSIEAAIVEQLGLRLSSEKQAFNVLVVDRLEHPTDN